MEATEREHAVLRDMCAGVKRLDQRLTSIEKATTIRTLFPKLETIAVSSIYGVDCSIWPEGNWREFENLHLRKSPLVTSPDPSPSIGC